MDTCSLCGHMMDSVATVEFSRCRLSRNSLLGFETAMNLYSHPMEACRALINDAEQPVTVPRWWSAAQAVVADGILKLVNLRHFGLKLPL